MSGGAKLIPEHSFVADEVAAWSSSQDPDSRLFLRVLVLSMLRERDRGSTRLVLRDRAAVEKLFIGHGATEIEAHRWIDALKRHPERVLGTLAGRDHTRPFVIENGAVYFQQIYELERRVASHLRARIALPSASSPWLEGALHDVTRSPCIANGRALKLSDEQQAAIARCIRAPMTLVSGGPGTGKTSIVLSILRVLARGGEIGLDEVGLCAPTGRAADRLRGSIELALRRLVAPAFADHALLQSIPESMTVHRLLGYSPQRRTFRHHQRNPLRARFLIVDESSMLDLVLMERLLSALRPDSQVVFLGDADQLPSVEAGAVFRDLCRCLDAVRLTKSYRVNPNESAGRAILSIARKINRGDAACVSDPSSDGVRHVDQPTFEGIERIDPSGRDRALSIWFEQLLYADQWIRLNRVFRIVTGRFRDEDWPALELLFQRLEDRRILCATRRGRLGVVEINDFFHRRVAVRSQRSSPLLVGEPVIVQQNDYDKNLYNGDQGLILWVQSDDRRTPMVVFRKRDEFRAFPVDALRANLELGYAITVHKAQGSEYDRVIVTLPDFDSEFVTREIVYTAMTRARQGVLFIATAERLESAIRQKEQRSTGLVERLSP